LAIIRPSDVGWFENRPTAIAGNLLDNRLRRLPVEIGNGD
jgi:hypothetical protein